MMPGQSMTMIPKVAKTKQKNQSSRKKKKTRQIWNSSFGCEQIHSKQSLRNKGVPLGSNLSIWAIFVVPRTLNIFD